MLIDVVPSRRTRIRQMRNAPATPEFLSVGPSSLPGIRPNASHHGTTMLDRMGWKIPFSLRRFVTLAAYLTSHHGSRGMGSAPWTDKLDKAVEASLNGELTGYPRNHIYQVQKGRLRPDFLLFERERIINARMPTRFKSFMDIGCCRGYYVLRAAANPSCTHSLGIDIDEPFVMAAKRVRNYFGVSNAHFMVAHLDEISKDPRAFGGPFEVILMIGTYHYLFWGSGRCSDAYRDHREILRRLATVCTGKLYISGRFELNDLPRKVREMATRSEASHIYNTREFLSASEEFFRVRKVDRMGKYPLYELVPSASRETPSAGTVIPATGTAI